MIMSQSGASRRSLAFTGELARGKLCHVLTFRGVRTKFMSRLDRRREFTGPVVKLPIPQN